MLELVLMQALPRRDTKLETVVAMLFSLRCAPNMGMS